MELNAIVSQRIEVSPDLIILRIVPEGWDLPDFSAGQFAVLGLPESARRTAFADREPETDSDKPIKRAYSIASSSRNKEYIEFYITLVRSGKLTPRLFALKSGDRVFLGKKITGMFTLDMIEGEPNILLIGTGTGLAPYMSMLRTHLVCGGPRRFGILHGARHSWDLGYRSELITLKHMCSNVTYLPIISRPKDEVTPWGGMVGYVQDAWESDELRESWGGEPSPENTHVFLCGGPAMVDDMCSRLEAVGFVEHTKKNPGHIHVERYW